MEPLKRQPLGQARPRTAADGPWLLEQKKKEAEGDQRREQRLSRAQNGKGSTRERKVLGTSFPPADGAFRSDVNSYLRPITDFLVSTGAPLLVNVYPYFSYIGNKAQIDLQYALFNSDGIVVPGGIRYQNLFYAIVDAVYAALEKSGAASMEIVVSETGWPSAGGDTTTVDFARTYNTNLVRRVRDGTPKRPGRAIETYIFGLFDENQKSPEFEKNFGLFFPNRQPKYPISF
ncbi:hypothetical protein ABFX02_03G052900 [Erythranthe guttata]